LLILARATERGTSSETLRQMVDDGQANALSPLDAGNYRACVDRYAGVYVDARLSVIAWHIAQSVDDQLPSS
jgi:hypothetical protein